MTERASPTNTVSADALNRAAQRVADRLSALGGRLVLAESCTAGLIAHTLSGIPGASNWLCGSAVVYRDGTKSAWLNVSPDSLSDPAIGAVSEQTALAMCRGVLARTSEATVAASVTGHLGPDAPRELDGVIFVAAGDAEQIVVRRATLISSLPEGAGCPTLRIYRQRVAALVVLEVFDEWFARG